MRIEDWRLDGADFVKVKSQFKMWSSVQYECDTVDALSWLALDYLLIVDLRLGFPCRSWCAYVLSLGWRLVGLAI